MEEIYYISIEAEDWTRIIFTSSSKEKAEQVFNESINLPTLELSRNLRGLTSDTYKLILGRFKNQKNIFTSIMSPYKEVIKEEVLLKYPHLGNFKSRLRKGQLEDRKNYCLFFYEGFKEGYYDGAGIKVEESENGLIFKLFNLNNPEKEDIFEIKI